MSIVEQKATNVHYVIVTLDFNKLNFHKNSYTNIL